jgi:hypothetical protein
MRSLDCDGTDPWSASVATRDGQHRVVDRHLAKEHTDIWEFQDDLAPVRQFQRQVSDTGCIASKRKTGGLEREA